MNTFTDEASLSFIPGWADTYTIKAWAIDEAHNCIPEGKLETKTFEVID